jgi:hypothetical protein
LQVLPHWAGKAQVVKLPQRRRHPATPGGDAADLLQKITLSLTLDSPRNNSGKSLRRRAKRV